MKVDKRGRTRPRMTLNVTKKVQPIADFMNESFQKWKRPEGYLIFDDFIMKSGATNDPLQTTYKEKARFNVVVWTIGCKNVRELRSILYGAYKSYVPYHIVHKICLY